MKILILGSDGFIGYHLSESILKDPRFANAEIVGVDLYNNRTHMLPQDNRLKFYQFNILNDTTTVDRLIEECDVLLPFVAIATPKLYVEQPLRVFELDFESNLRVIKLAHKLGKRVIFPSTSEVYGEPEISPQHEQSNIRDGFMPVLNNYWIE